MREPSAAPGLPAVGTWAEQVRWIDRVFKRLGHGPNRPHSTDLAYARDILRGARDHAAEQATLAGVSDPAAVRALVAAARAVFGVGYLEARFPASQGYVSQHALDALRDALQHFEGVA